jgi:hypothetical protein
MAHRGKVAKINLAELEKLCALQCTDEEIAAWFGVATRTIERRRKVRAFAEVMERGKAKGRISLRRLQMKLLEDGNATMGIWLGKQILGQTDHSCGEGVSSQFFVLMPGITVGFTPSERARVTSADCVTVDVSPTHKPAALLE